MPTRNSVLTPITYVRDPISRPDEPRHFMVLKPLAHEVTATVDGRPLAHTHHGLRMQEAGYDLYDPSVFFPRADVDMSRLRRSAQTKRCPLKGQNQYFDVVDGDRILENAAWSFEQVLEFDARLELLRGRIAFDTSRVQIVELTASVLAPR